MEKRILNYVSYLASVDITNMTAEERAAFYKDLRIQIGFFQHERLIHLIVTVTFAILTVVSLLFSLLLTNIWVILLTFALTILLVPYIRHYYILENNVQKMYTYYDLLIPYLNELDCV